VELLRLPTLEPLKTLNTPLGKKDRFCSVQFSPDGKTVIAGTAMGHLHKAKVADAGGQPPPSYRSALPATVSGSALAPDLLVLLRAVKEKPGDDAPRLALADWLEERGDVRGDFIRVQCELNKLGRGDPRRGGLQRRENNMLKKYAKEWAGPLDKLALSCFFRRGLLRVEFKPKKLFSRATMDWMASDEAAWVSSLTLYDATVAEVKQLARLPFLEHLNALEFGMSPVPLAALLASPYLRHLTELDLAVTEQGTAGVKALTASNLLAQLTSLNLGGNDIGDAGVAALAASPRAANLTALMLSGNEITAAGVRALAASRHITKLTVLDLASNYLSDEGAMALATSANFANLTTLRLSFTAIGSDGVQAIADSRYLNKLTELDLGSMGDLNTTPGAKALRQRLGKRVNFL
jgi:uncharacterized protein (TIGR02996 family)